MTTENTSPSYLEEREKVRKWLSTTKEGQHTVGIMKQQDGDLAVSKLLDDDQWASWGDLMTEHKDDLVLASSCAELRNAADLARKSNSLNQPPMSQGARWMRFFSPPIWYVLRRQVEVGDPDYWNDPVNVMREAMENSQWSTLPADYIRGELLKYVGASTGSEVLKSA